MTGLGRPSRRVAVALLCAVAASGVAAAAAAEYVLAPTPGEVGPAPGVPGAEGGPTGQEAAEHRCNRAHGDPWWWVG